MPTCCHVTNVYPANEVSISAIESTSLAQYFETRQSIIFRINIAGKWQQKNRQLA